MICDNWDDFKTFVKEMRAVIRDAMKRQGGGNAVSIDIKLVDYSIDDWVSVNPFSIDLRTRKGTVFRNGRYHFKVNIKRLLLTQRFTEEG